MRDTFREGSPYPVVAGLFALVLAVYWQVGGHAFIHLDDENYVTGNPHVLQGLTREGVSWAFTTFHAANWHPLTWLSHMADVELFGPSPGWHHRMNALFHLVNTELLFLVLWRMTGGLWQSAFAAALFAVHPLHVESVAWVSERKDVLSTLFWILTMGAYARYARKPGVVRYLPVAAFFSLGLLCKPMLVTLPFVLLLLDWWPLGRLHPAGSSSSPSWRLPALRLLEKAPLLAMSAVSCALTILAQDRGGALATLESIPFGLRLSNAAVSYAAYLWKAVWPSPLAVFYPHPAGMPGGIPSWEVAGSVLLLLAISFGAVREGRRRPWLAVGWSWYLGTLVPVIGLAQVGAQALADRYTYVPLIGVFVAAAWGGADLLSGVRPWRIVRVTACLAAITALSAASWVQAGYWRDSVTLFSRTLAVTEGNWLAWNNLGQAYGNLGRLREAADCFREALRIRPEFAEAWNNLGMIHIRLGRLEEAIGCFREALRIRPGYAKAWNYLGVAYDRLGDPLQAGICYGEARRIRAEEAGLSGRTPSLRWEFQGSGSPRRKE